jgi:putative ABC transport system substrate-binding protein
MLRRTIFLTLAFIVLTAAPVATAREKSETHRIGFLTAGKVNAFKVWLGAFEDEAKRLRGNKAVVLGRYGDGRPADMPRLAGELVGQSPDVVVVHGGHWGRLVDETAKKSGKNLPIVFAVDSDPIGKRVFASLARPGGNITGITDYHANLASKRLALLKEVIPSLSNISVILDPLRPDHKRQLNTLRPIAKKLGITVATVPFSKADDLKSAIQSLQRNRSGALMHFGYALFGAFHKKFGEFVLANAIPGIGTIKRNAYAGFLMSYGTDFSDMYRQAALLVQKILNGAKPADLPVQQPTKFALVVNLKVAKSIRINVPGSILVRADTVIE